VNKEVALSLACGQPEYLVTMGSHLYGNATEESDVDIRGFAIPPYEYLVGQFCNFQLQNFPEEQDKVIFSFGELLSLLLKGDPLAFEMLWVPEEKILTCTGVGRQVRDLRTKLGSLQFAMRVRGYAQSEWRKVRGVTLQPVKRTPSQDTVIEDIRTVFKPPKPAMDEIIKFLYQHFDRVEVPARRKLGEKRKKQVECYGFCVSSASHTIRLLGELIEFLKTGRITFPRPNADFLLAIKQGKVEYSVCEGLFEDLNLEADSMIELSTLPKRSSFKQMEKFFYRVIAERLIKYGSRLYEYL